MTDCEHLNTGRVKGDTSICYREVCADCGKFMGLKSVRNPKTHKEAEKKKNIDRHKPKTIGSPKRKKKKKKKKTDSRQRVAQDQKSCSHIKKKTIRTKPPHWKKEVCRDCGKFIKWVSKPKVRKVHQGKASVPKNSYRWYQ